MQEIVTNQVRDRAGNFVSRRKFATQIQSGSKVLKYSENDE